MPRCLYCLTLYETFPDNPIMDSSCECGENVCEEDKRAEFAESESTEPAKERDK